jgi:hypothetical protein
MSESCGNWEWVTLDGFDNRIYDSLEAIWENLDYYSLWDSTITVYGVTRSYEFPLASVDARRDDDDLRFFEEPGQPKLYIDRVLGDGNTHDEAWLTSTPSGDTVRKATVPRNSVPEEVPHNA